MKYSDGSVAEDAMGLDGGRGKAVAPHLVGSLVVFAIAFVYTAMASLAIETYVLPVLLPQLHAGHGLMVGHDSVGFQTMASEMATRIQTTGWAVWSFGEDRQRVIGIIAAVYALTGVHEPIIVIPIYSILYAVSTTCIYRTTFAASGNQTAGWFAAVVFLFWPSASMIYADMHKDAWSCAGILLLFAGWTEIEERKAISIRTLSVFILVCCTGLVLLWIVRPYMIKLALGGLSLGLLAIIAVNAAFANSWRQDVRRYAAFAFVLANMLAISLYSSAPLMDAPIRAPTFILKGEPTGATITAPRGNPEATALASSSPIFRHTLGAILAVREGFVGTPAGSIIDKDVRFPSMWSFIEYLPRALEIGLLAPFPNMWFERGMTQGSRAMRLVSGLEMCAAYSLLLGWAFLIASTERNRLGSVVFVATACLTIICVMGFAVPNIGTLYRMRYPLFMIVVALGATGWAMPLAKTTISKRK